MFKYKTDCYKIYDIRLIEKLGLIPAVVLTEISNVRSGVEADTFPFSYIADNDYTKAIDGLLNLNLLSIDYRNEGGNWYVVNHDNVCHILYDETIDCANIPNTLKLKKSKASKQDAIKNNLLKNLPEDLPTDLFELYASWVSVALTKGVMTKDMFMANVDMLDTACTTVHGDFADYDTAKAKEILTQTIACGYNTFQWAITNYARQHPSTTRNSKPVPNQIQINNVKTELSTKGY